MKNIVLSFVSLLSVTAFAQQKDSSAVIDATKDLLTVDAACGQCKFGLPGESCDLAVRIKGKAYFIDGSHIDQHGDAHAKDGFCNAIRKAQVQGRVINNRFKASYFKLLPEKGIASN